MTSKKKSWAAVTFLVLLHAVIVFAGFVAPYDPTCQNRNLPFVPPTRPHFIDTQGRFHLRPFICQWISRPQSLYEYEESHDKAYPIHFLVKGPEYKIAGLFSAHTHLFGVEAPAQIFPIGSRIVSVIDAYDAMICNRCYRQGLPHEDAVRRLLEGGGAQFDPVVVPTFVEIAKEEAADVFAAIGVGPSAVI